MASVGTCEFPAGDDVCPCEISTRAIVDDCANSYLVAGTISEVKSPGLPLILASLNLCDKGGDSCSEGLKRRFDTIGQGEYIRLPAVTHNNRPVYVLDMGSSGKRYLYHDAVMDPNGRWYVGLQINPRTEFQKLQSYRSTACPEGKEWNVNVQNTWWNGKLPDSMNVLGVPRPPLMNFSSVVKCPAAPAASAGRPNSTMVVGSLTAALAELSCIGRIQRLSAPPRPAPPRPAPPRPAPPHPAPRRR